MITCPRCGYRFRTTSPFPAIVTIYKEPPRRPNAYRLERGLYGGTRYFVRFAGIRGPIIVHHRTLTSARAMWNRIVAVADGPPPDRIDQDEWLRRLSKARGKS